MQSVPTDDGLSSEITPFKTLNSYYKGLFIHLLISRKLSIPQKKLLYQTLIVLKGLKGGLINFAVDGAVINET